MGGVLRGFLCLQRLTSQENKGIQVGGGRTATQIGGVLQYFLDKFYGLGAPKHCPMLQMFLAFSSRIVEINLACFADHTCNSAWGPSSHDSFENL